VKNIEIKIESIMRDLLIEKYQDESFRKLDDIHQVLCILVFKLDVEPSDNIRKFLRNFDRLDQLSVKNRIIKSVKDGIFWDIEILGS